MTVARGKRGSNFFSRPFVARQRRVTDARQIVIWRRLRCSTCVGLPLDPNVNTPGIRSRGSGVQVRLERKALAAAAASHLLLRVESNGS